MKKSKKCFLKSSLAITVMTSSCLLSTVSTFAQESQGIQISPWAIETLNEGEKYGLFPMTWYQEEFQAPITTKQLQSLIDNVNTKLKSLKLTAQETSSLVEIKGTTRGDVVNALYNVLAQYTIVDKLNAQKLTPVEYFKEQGLIQGTEKGLELDKPCTMEQAAVLASKFVENTFSNLNAGAKGFSYKVTNGKNTLYLLGSIHIGTTDMYPLRQELKDAFKESDGLFVEVNLFETAKNYQDYLDIAQYTDGTTLKDHVSEETYKLTLDALKKVGLPEESYIQFKPWSIANELSTMVSSKSTSMEEASVAKNLGVDLYFSTTALVQEKPIIELEGIEYQAHLFDDLSSDVQNNYLNTAVNGILNAKDFENASNTMNDWQTQWYNGDYQNFKNTYNEALAKDELSSMLFGKRDENMAAKLSEVLEKETGKTYFVVVGAGHLEVPNSVIDQLKAKGYTVTTFFDESK